MIEPARRRRVRELLATGEYSQREIAADCGVARSTVQRIQRSPCGCRCAEPCGDCPSRDPLAPPAETLTGEELARYEALHEAKQAREVRRAS